MLSSRPVAFAIDSHVYPYKTPGRVKTRAENAVPTTVHAKGKETMIQTPFHAGKQAPQKAPLTTQALGKQTVSRPTRILGDKTPFPNRTNIQKPETPASQLLKLPVPSFLEPQSQLQLDKTPDSLRRPSSARTQDRVPRNANKLFVTPMNTGNHWDVNELSISPPEVQAQESQPPENDLDDIEYMPPNTLYLAFEPVVDIELPNYKEVGKALFELAYTCPIGDISPTEIQINEKDVQLPGWDLLPVPELESDDPFQQGRKLKSTTVHTQNKATPLAKRKVVPVNKMLARPPSQILPPKSTPSLRSEPLASSFKPRKDSSSRLTPSVPRKLPVKGAVSNVSHINSVNPTRSTVNKAKATATLRPVKLATKPIQIDPSCLAIPASLRSRPTTNSSMAVRRPITSTSQYKTLPGSRRAVLAGGMKEDQGTRSAEMDPLVVGTCVDLCEDFKFNV